MLGWHFTSDKLRDGSPIPAINEWLVHQGPIVPCKSGLHVAEHPFDALKYATGSMLHRVELLDELKPHGNPVDKYAGRRRRIIAGTNAEQLLRWFAKWCALQVVDNWEAPQVVKDWLETGDPELQSAARSAAMRVDSAAHSADSAARSAAISAVEVAAAAVAISAAESAVLSVAESAVRPVTRSAMILRQRNEFERLVNAAFADLLQKPAATG